MVKLGLAVVDKGNGRLEIAGVPYNDRDDLAVDAFEEVLLRLAGVSKIEVADFFKSMRRQGKRMKLKSVRMAVVSRDGA